MGSMSDERIIYISPEDDLTSVRERLEQVQPRSVTLVLPATTQLRGDVAWQLLYKRARELGKDVLIVSSDPKIRSVAHHVGKFRVVTSLEASTAAGKSRPPSRPARTNPGRVRYANSSRSLSRHESRGLSGSRLRQLSDTTGAQRSASSRELRDQRPYSDEAPHREDMPQNEPGQYGPSYNFRVDTDPSIHPLSPQQLEEEPDLLENFNFNVARDIREAALRSRPPEREEKKLEEKPRRPSGKLTLPRHISVPLAREDEDPFASMDDDLPPPSHPEQRGGISLDHLGAQDYEMQEEPEDFIDGELEYRGDDTGAFIPIADAHETPRLVEELFSDEEDISGPSSTVYGVQPRSSRPEAKGPVPLSPEQEEDALPPIEDQPTHVVPPEASPRPSSTSRCSKPLQQQQGTSRRSEPLNPQQQQTSRRSQPLPPQETGKRSRPLQPAASSTYRSEPLPPAPQRTSRPLQQKAPRSTSLVAEGGSRSIPASTSRSSRAAAGRRPSPVTIGSRLYAWRRVLTIAALVVLVLVILRFIEPAADVTLTLQSHPYSHALVIVARQGSNQPGAIASGTIPAQMQQRTFARNGTITATGTRKVGKNAASGSVVFTNNGKRPVIVPTGTTVSTSSGIQFMTDAELSVDVPGSPGNAVPVPVHAVEQGDIGNVPAGTIVVIPQDNLSAIAKDNNVAVTDVSLKVNNDQPTNGGGLGTVHTIQQQDIDAARNALRSQAQSDVNAWLNQLNNQGFTGKPGETDQWVNPPQNGQTVQDTSMPVTLNVTIFVLMARNDDVQKAAASQLSNFLQRDPNYHNMIIVQDAQHPIRLRPIKAPTSDASSITLNADASALALSDISQEQIRKDIAGLSLKTAQERLSQLLGVQHVDIKLSPSIPLLPFWTGHINVTLQPAPE